MAKMTTEHDEIRRWVTQRGGCPAHVKSTGSGEADVGVLRIDFPGFSGEGALECISWDDFFKKFGEQQLAFIYQDRSHGGRLSRFNKLVKRPEAERDRGTDRDEVGRPPDALTLLEAQHRETERLLNELADGGDGISLRRNFLELADLLTIHATIEERHFYPAVRAVDTANLVDRSLQDHLEVKRVLLDLLETRPSDKNLLPKIEELGGLVEEHVIEEEHDLFPRVRKLLDRRRLEEIARQMMETTVQLQREGAPHEQVYEEVEGPSQKGA